MDVVERGAGVPRSTVADVRQISNRNGGSYVAIRKKDVFCFVGVTAILRCGRVAVRN